MGALTTQASPRRARQSAVVAVLPIVTCDVDSDPYRAFFRAPPFISIGASASVSGSVRVAMPRNVRKRTGRMACRAALGRNRLQPGVSPVIRGLRLHLKRPDVARRVAGARFAALVSSCRTLLRGRWEVFVRPHRPLIAFFLTTGRIVASRPGLARGIPIAERIERIGGDRDRGKIRKAASDPPV